MRLLFLALVVCCATASASEAHAQSADGQAIREAAIADLSAYFRRAERRDLLPSSVPQVSLYGPIRASMSDEVPDIALCSMDVLRLTYYAPPDNRQASRVEPTRSLSSLNTETVFRVAGEPNGCLEQDPSSLWFRIPRDQNWDRSNAIRIVALAVGLIEATRTDADAFQGMDLRAFVEATPAEAIEALRNERPERIGQLSWSACASDQESFCQRAEIEFGSLGPLTRLALTIRRSRPSGDRTWLEAATVQKTFSAIP